VEKLVVEEINLLLLHKVAVLKEINLLLLHKVAILGDINLLPILKKDVDEEHGRNGQRKKRSIYIYITNHMSFLFFNLF
jgi:hypothetical protein